MNRKIVTERTYALGQYQNIKLHDEIEVPEELYLNTELVEKLRGLQFVQLELMFRKYLRLQTELEQFNLEDSINALTELKSNTLSDINKILE